MQAPPTTRVLRSPSSSVSTQPLRLTLPRLAEGVGPLLPQRVVERSTQLRDALLVGLVGEVRAERAAAGVGGVGVDAGAALAEDARPARGQPGQVAAEDLLGVGRIGELDPETGEDGIDLGHALPASGPHTGSASTTGTPVRGGRNPGSHPIRSPRRRTTLDPCGLVCSTSAPTRATCSSWTPTAVRRRCRRPPSRSRCGWPSTSTTDGTVTDEGVDALVEFVGHALELAEDKGCEEIYSFATSAVRDADNSDDVLAPGAQEDRRRHRGAAGRGRGPADLPRRTTLVRLVLGPPRRLRHRRRARSRSRAVTTSRPTSPGRCRSAPAG